MTIVGDQRPKQQFGRLSIHLFYMNAGTHMIYEGMLKPIIGNSPTITGTGTGTVMSRVS